MRARGVYKLEQQVSATGKVSWLLTGTTLDGKRLRDRYDTEADGLIRKQSLEQAGANLSSREAQITYAMTAAQLKDAERAVLLLNKGTLCDAVEYYNDNYTPVADNKTVAEVYPLLLKAKAHLRPKSLRQYDCDLKCFVDDHPNIIMSRVSSAVLKRFLTNPAPIPGHPQVDRPWSIARQEYLLKVLAAFFSWAADEGYCGTNPASKVKLASVIKDQLDPAVLPLDDLQVLLDVAWDYYGGIYAAYVVLATWAAIRPEEVRRLAPERINLEEGYVRIQGNGAKTRARRVVSLAPNIIAMLRDLKARGLLTKESLNIDPIAWSYIRTLAGLKAADSNAKWLYLPPEERLKHRDVPLRAPCAYEDLKEWVKDVLRHTGISHHLAWFQNEGATATWAGNSPTIIHKHYKGLVTPAEARRFWTMLPKLLTAAGITAGLPKLPQLHA